MSSLQRARLIVLMLNCKRTRALQSKWELPSVEEREVSERDRQTLTILREQRGAQVPDNHRCASYALALVAQGPARAYTRCVVPGCIVVSLYPCFVIT